MLTAEELIKTLGLVPLPQEGGFFTETYRSSDTLPKNQLAHIYSSERNLCTAIYYLLTRDTFSAMHRLASDEVFHFYCGDSVEMLLLHPDGSGSLVRLGIDILSGERPQVVVPRGVWQGARVRDGGSFTLLGTTVTPGFDFADYEHGERDRLTADYPDFRDMITELTR